MNCILIVNWQSGLILYSFRARRYGSGGLIHQSLHLLWAVAPYINEAAVDRPAPPYGSGYHIFQIVYQQKPDFMIWMGDNTHLREVDWKPVSAYCTAIPIFGLLRKCSHY